MALALVIDYGFNETPDVPAALAKVKAPGLDPMRAACFVGREFLALKKRGSGMAFRRKRLLDFMFENAFGATVFFHLQPNNVIEIDSQTVSQRTSCERQGGSRCGSRDRAIAAAGAFWLRGWPPYPAIWRAVTLPGLCRNIEISLY